MLNCIIPNRLDWIIGSPEIAINSQEDFFHLMIHNQKRPVPLLVFNLDSDAVREAQVIPDFGWGGEGCLGCNVASGALHRIPPNGSHAVKPPVLQEPSLGSESAIATTTATDAAVAAPPMGSESQPVQVQVAASAPNPNLKPIPGFESSAQPAEGDASLFFS